ncbi:hypothetical protein DUY54_12325 [Enterococcus faecalis]|nr:hypothetical protein [Enterococcus faecalis]
MLFLLSLAGTFIQKIPRKRCYVFSEFYGVAVADLIAGEVIYLFFLKNNENTVNNRLFLNRTI